MRFKRTRELLLYARDEVEVLRLVRDAIAHLDPGELAALPPECRDIKKGESVHSAAVSCLHQDLRLRGDPDVGELVRQVAELYAAASVRLSHLEHQRQ